MTTPGGVFIETFGCQMNDHDSAQMLKLLGAAGFHAAPAAEEADVVLVNTCSVREKPAHKVRSLLGRYRLLKKERPGLVLGVAGCFAQQEKGRLLEAYPFVDLVFGPDAVAKVAELVERARSERVLDTRFLDRQEQPFVNELALGEPGQVTAFVTIMKGCDNVCSFCIVPHTRGREVSRAREDVLDEVARLAAAGVREVTLIGQNVNSYGADAEGRAFSDLVRGVARVPGIARIRFTTSNPWDLSPHLVRCFAEVPELMPYLHLPVQSGSDRVLRAMRRKHSRAEYEALVDSLRGARPGLALSTDVIVGYPGETDEDFRSTLSLVEKVGYAFIYSFKYSPRPHTSAVRQPDSVPEEVKSARLAELNALQAPATQRAMEATAGRVHEVLVEGRSRNDPAWMSGRLPDFKIVNFPAPLRVRGQVLPVRVTEAFPHSLKGEVVLRGDEDDAGAFRPSEGEAVGEAPPEDPEAGPALVELRPRGATRGAGR